MHVGTLQPFSALFSQTAWRQSTSGQAKEHNDTSGHLIPRTIHHCLWPSLSFLLLFSWVCIRYAIHTVSDVDITSQCIGQTEYYFCYSTCTDWTQISEPHFHCTTVVSPWGNLFGSNKKHDNIMTLQPYRSHQTRPATDRYIPSVSDVKLVHTKHGQPLTDIYLQSVTSNSFTPNTVGHWQIYTFSQWRQTRSHQTR